MRDIPTFVFHPVLTIVGTWAIVAQPQ